ncbi:acylglycerol kinase family protein [Streptomyces sp. f51]|uniref:acylglycerol kinase family protein n=1 Tax=Streptomyces sp. f51 TaxID=1827742 RepID=UPI00211D23C9|nr:acylglycerol kinase family protein [Streptomyces sp. f51]
MACSPSPALTSAPAYPDDTPPSTASAPLLPLAELRVPSRDTSRNDLLDRAARDAEQVQGALGVCGGDGTVSAAADVALERSLLLWSSRA